MRATSNENRRFERFKRPLLNLIRRPVKEYNRGRRIFIFARYKSRENTEMSFHRASVVPSVFFLFFFFSIPDPSFLPSFPVRFPLPFYSLSMGGREGRRKKEKRTRVTNSIKRLASSLSNYRLTSWEGLGVYVLRFRLFLESIRKLCISNKWIIPESGKKEREGNCFEKVFRQTKCINSSSIRGYKMQRWWTDTFRKYRILLMKRERKRKENWENSDNQLDINLLLKK